MYSIGDFSKITQLTVKALRYYHEKSILTPSVVNKDNSYRYYSEGDIEKANLVKKLKDLEFSLEEIQNILFDMNEDADAISVLKSKKASIDADVKKLRTVASALDSIINKEREANKMTEPNPDIQIKKIPDVLIVSTRWNGAYSETGKAMGKVYKTAGRHAAGPAFNLYFDGEYKEVAEVESCLPVKNAISESTGCKTIKGGEFVSFIHKGPYEQIGQSYKVVIDYINENNLQMQIPTREVYLKGPGMIFKGNPDKYLTEILIPLA